MKFKSFKRLTELKEEIEKQELEIKTLKRIYIFKKTEVFSITYEFVLKNGARAKIYDERDSFAIQDLMVMKNKFIARKKRKLAKLHKEFESLK